MQIFRPDSDIIPLSLLVGSAVAYCSLCERRVTEIAGWSAETPLKSIAVPSRLEREFRLLE